MVVIFRLPLVISKASSKANLTLECLGTVVYDRSAYHTQKDIFPVGYRTTIIDKGKKWVMITKNHVSGLLISA